jgi:RHS repeat-associated protein
VEALQSEAVNAALQTALPEHRALAASPQFAENSRLGFGTAASTSRWASGFSISSSTLDLSVPLYDGRVGSRCTGKERDSESQLDYFGARYYASSMGRFMSPDWSTKIMPVPYGKLGDPQSLNLYAYVMNNPLTGVDADGHQCTGDICKKIRDYGLSAVNAYNQAKAFATGNYGQLGSAPKTPPAPALPLVTTSISGGKTTLTVSTHENTTTSTWDSLTKVDSKYQKDHPDHTWIGRPLSAMIVGVETGAGVANTREYGPEGAAIKTNDPNGQWLHGGGGKEDSQEPNQELKPTYGCTRLHNQDAITLGNFEKQYGMPIEWERTQ